MHEAHAAARKSLQEQAARLGIHDLSEVAEESDGRGSVTFGVDIGSERITLRVVLPVAFPFGEIETFVDTASWRRFAHQCSSSGKLCLQPNALAARDGSRLVEAAEGAIEWLQDAAAGTLTSAAERYELPDFPIHVRDRRLLFDEEAAEYDRWSTRVGQSGKLLLAEQSGGWPIEEFRASDGTVVARRRSIREPTKESRIVARWVLVHAFAAYGHRVAATWSELRALIPDLDTIVYKVWHEAEGDLAVLAVGAPMPSAWGGPPAAIHWHPIVFPSNRAARHITKQELRLQNRSRKKGLKPTELWKSRSPFQAGERVPWAHAEDVSSARLYGRGGKSSRVFQAPVLIGCGAIGSALADILVRGGLPRIGLIDKETIEYGNLCRHILDAASVDEGKALMLGLHLRLASPSVLVEPAPIALPPITTAAQTTFDKMIASADLIVDASGSDEVLEWLGTVPFKFQIASVWTNADASVGVGVLSPRGAGTDLTVGLLREHVRDAVAAGMVPGVSADSYRGPPLLVPGTGCWHPTFRGSWGRLVGLSAALAEWLCSVVRGGRDGRVIVFRAEAGGWRVARAWTVASSTGSSSAL